LYERRLGVAASDTASVEEFIESFPRSLASIFMPFSPASISFYPSWPAEMLGFWGLLLISRSEFVAIFAVKGVSTVCTISLKQGLDKSEKLSMGDIWWGC
jgi:hypothetical protein